jgi:hypothetical protein
MGQHRIQGGNDGGMGQMTGMIAHKKAPIIEKWAQSAPIPNKKWA